MWWMRLGAQEMLMSDSGNAGNVRGNTRNLTGAEEGMWETKPNIGTKMVNRHNLEYTNHRRRLSPLTLTYALTNSVWAQITDGFLMEQLHMPCIVPSGRVRPCTTTWCLWSSTETVPSLTRFAKARPSNSSWNSRKMVASSPPLMAACRKRARVCRCWFLMIVGGVRKHLFRVVLRHLKHMNLTYVGFCCLIFGDFDDCWWCSKNMCFAWFYNDISNTWISPMVFCLFWFLVFFDDCWWCSKTCVSLGLIPTSQAHEICLGFF